VKHLLSRHERRKLRTRRRLLEAARLVITRMGYETAGVLDITEEADVSKGTFYLHFKDKEDLTRALILEGFEALRAQIDTTLTGERDLNLLAEALRVVFRYAAENRDLFRLMLGQQASAELNMMALDYFSDAVKDTIIRTTDAAHELPYPPDLLAHFITGAGVQLGQWWIEDDHGLSADDMAEIMFRLLSDGILSGSMLSDGADGRAEQPGFPRKD
jgi:AcrR family transcriptional regulator